MSRTLPLAGHFAVLSNKTPGANPTLPKNVAKSLFFRSFSALASAGFATAVLLGVPFVAVVGAIPV